MLAERQFEGGAPIRRSEQLLQRLAAFPVAPQAPQRRQQGPCRVARDLPEIGRTVGAQPRFAFE